MISREVAHLHWAMLGFCVVCDGPVLLGLGGRLPIDGLVERQLPGHVMVRGTVPTIHRSRNPPRDIREYISSPRQHLCSGNLRRL